MTKEEIEKYNEAIDALLNGYDAYYFANKYGTNTHQKEFDLLSNLKGDKVSNALGWIKDCYDCYYKDEMDDSSPFAYLRSLLDNDK